MLGDSQKLRQVLLNLLGNAVKFTRQGGIALEAGWIGSNLRIACTTAASGSPQKNWPVFSSFSQVDASTTRSYTGTGLGLAISRQLMELLGLDLGAKPGQPGRAAAS